MLSVSLESIVYYWFQWHTHSTPCSFAISFVKYSLLSSNCLPCIPMLFIIISYLGSEFERDSSESLCNSPSQELHCHILPIHTQIQLDFTHLQVCIMSIHLPNNIVQVCVNDVVSSNCNELSWLNVYILSRGKILSVLMIKVSLLFPYRVFHYTWVTYTYIIILIPSFTIQILLLIATSVIFSHLLYIFLWIAL